MKNLIGLCGYLLLHTICYAQSFYSTNLPIVVIETEGRTIVDEPKTTVKMKIIYNGPDKITSLTDAPNIYDGFAGIEFRGSSSQLFPKKSYGFELRDAQGENKEVSLFGMPKNEDWILFASYNEKSLIHNVLAMKMATDMGIYASRTQYVEVVVNGRYEGIYVLMEKIKRSNGRLGITKMSTSDNVGDALTGGYIFKIDKTTGTGGSAGWYSKISPLKAPLGQRTLYLYEYPKFDEITSQQRFYLQNYVDMAEATLNGSTFRDSVNGYQRYFDPLSFAQMFIINETTKNVDGYRISTFFHKERDSKKGRIKAGPAWDYDLAFANADYCQGQEYYGWAYLFGDACPTDLWQVPFQWKRMLEDPSFVTAVYNEYRRMRAGPWKTERLNAYIDSLSAVLQQSQARNFQRWPVLGVPLWPNPRPVPGTWMGEVNELKNWLTNRLAWLDASMPGTLTGIEPGTVPAETMVEIAPNPFSEKARLVLKTPGPMEIRTEVFDINGRLLDTKLHFLEHSETEIFLPVTGPTGTYILRVHTPKEVIQKKMLKR
ncbi:CotH kinase family protein [Runella slithyformis]|uniref:Spore coat protein CotH n=1 Tax=Runella slithyformis (strain ATCC 29530 / DSM 19594 / LMG 11500 / NCIMB 11436 / LSU 4) TaxID=761193 RepID=A0A7U3ZHR9_RUNSL|nr:CotH kinase family protein [Runella slithyformis]AEI47445.1 Spore coat protein CotH [Runella slithyformis DSM 19594]